VIKDQTTRVTPVDAGQEGSSDSHLRTSKICVTIALKKNETHEIPSITGVARLFFLRAKIEDTIFGVGLRIENSEKQKKF